MVKSRNVNMTDTSLLSIAKFTFPLIASSFLQQLFNSADTAVVGRFVSSQALAAVGGNAPVISLLINLFNGLAVGANVVVARFLGEGNREKVSKAVKSVYALGIFCGFVVALLGISLSRSILALISSPPDIIDLASTYLKIYFAGMPFIMMFNFGSAILRSNGETRKPLVALSVSGVINVGLNVFFVVVLKMSVVGVGLATVISNAVSASVVLIDLVKRKDELSLSKGKFKIDMTVIGSALKIGIPAGIQGTVFAISNVTILSAINSFGSKATAGATAANMYEQFSYFITAAFSQAAVSFVSHNYGARNIENCKKAYRNILKLSLSSEFAFDLFVMIFRYQLIGIFTTDAQVVRYAIDKMCIVVSLHFLIATYEIAAGALRGFGKSVIPAMLTLVFVCGSRLCWLFFALPLHRTYSFLFIAYPLSWVLCGIFVTTAYHIELSRISRQG